jgi:hypothetical protein
MNRQTGLCVVALLASCALACGGESEPKSDADQAQDERAGSRAAAETDTDKPAARDDESDEQESDESTVDEAEETGGSAVAPQYADACSERRGSWSKPCHEDPDPCKLDSGYPGDEYCLLPPPAGQGVQIHFGPKDHADADAVKGYVLNPGEEFNSYATVNIPTTETKYYAYIKISMRPGSHHLINNLMDGHGEEGFVDANSGCGGEMGEAFPGTQNLITESPPQGIPAPENEGLGRTLPGNSSLCQNYHRYNTTDKPALSEIWYNIWFVDESEITQKTNGVFVNAGPWEVIQPGEKIVLTTTADIKQEGRIVSLFGHRHVSTERFAAWLNDELIYDSWDWVESRLFNYDTITDNPPVNSAAKMDGAVSGMLSFKPGDQVKIECHVNNASDHTLRFANELYTGEMCILFGQTVGGELRKMR